jgi:hypothetical protein
MLKKKIRANFQRIIEVFTQKIVTKLSKIWIWDPEKTLFRIPDLGVKNASDLGSRSATLNISINILINVYREQISYTSLVNTARDG